MDELQFLGFDCIYDNVKTLVEAYKLLGKKNINTEKMLSAIIEKLVSEIKEDIENNNPEEDRNKLERLWKL